MVQLQYELWSVARVVSLDEDTAESFKPVRYVVELVGDLRQSWPPVVYHRGFVEQLFSEFSICGAPTAISHPTDIITMLTMD